MVAVTDSLFEIFNAVCTWIITSLQTVTGLFWVTSADGSHLTFLGTLAIISLGISIVFLMIRVIQNFLHFRG